VICLEYASEPELTYFPQNAVEQFSLDSNLIQTNEDIKSMEYSTLLLEESPFSYRMKGISKWRIVLFRASVFWIAVILADLVLVYFFGLQIRSYAGYFFGTEFKTTLVTLLFIEGAAIFAVGTVWAAGAMETTFEGDNLMTNPYYQKDQWKQRREQTEGQNITGKILMLAGGPLLIMSLLLFFA